MRKLLTIAGAILALAIPAAGQFTTVTGTVTDPNGILYSNARITAALAPPGVAPSPCYMVGGNCVPVPTPNSSPLDGAGHFTMNLVANVSITPAATQWTFTVCITPGIAPPLGTGPQCFSITTTVAGSTQDLSTSLSASAPALTTGSFGSVMPKGFGALSPLTFGAKWDVKICTDATFNNTSNTVTSAGQCQWSPADVGKLEFGTNACTASGCGVLFTPSNASAVVPQGTITGWNSPTSITVSGAATQSIAGFGMFLYGTDDTAALTALSSAIGRFPGCPTIIFPSGGVFTQKGQFGSVNAACVQNASSSTSNFSNIVNRGETFVGQGIGTTLIIPTPNFDFSTASCPNFGSPTTPVCFFGSQHNLVLRNFSIFGGGVSQSVANPNVIIATSTYGLFDNFGIEFWLQGDTNTSCDGLLVGGSVIHQGVFWGDCFNNVEISAINPQTTISETWLGANDGHALFIDGNAQVFSSRNFFVLPFGNTSSIDASAIGATLISHGDATLPFSATPSVIDVLLATSGAVAYIDGFQSGDNAATQKVMVTVAGTTLSLENSQLGINASPVSLQNAGTTNDQGGNSFPGSITGAGAIIDSVGDKGLPVPTCSFTSGGGTGPTCSLPSGPTNRFGLMQFTTGTGSPASSGTFTVTFGVNAPNIYSCVFSPAKTSLTGAWQATASVAMGNSPAVNQLTLNWSNAGVALTASTIYDVNYVCGQQ